MFLKSSTKLLLGKKGAIPLKNSVISSTIINSSTINIELSNRRFYSSKINKNPKVINLDYDDLIKNKDLSELIEEAYGKDGLGVLTVSGVPKVEQIRGDLLPIGQDFVDLPNGTKSKYEDLKSGYNFGWSHGKEMFNGKPDVSKGSYYNNPMIDVPTTDKELIEKYPFYCSENIWPKEELPQMEPLFKDMGQLIVSVGKLVSRQCDNYLKKIYKEDYESVLEQSINESKTTKARLLYYFSRSKEERERLEKQKNTAEEGEDDIDDSWCGWHLDHGSITGLSSSMFYDVKNKEQVVTKDDTAGLYIKDRHGELNKVRWNKDQLAFQIGESAQILSGGKLVATPHMVRGTKYNDIARITYVVFMQPQWDFQMKPPKNVPIQQCNIDVLKDGMDFNEFTQDRLDKYYGKQ